MHTATMEVINIDKHLVLFIKAFKYFLKAFS